MLRRPSGELEPPGQRISKGTSSQCVYSYAVRSLVRRASQQLSSLFVAEHWILLFLLTTCLTAMPVSYFCDDDAKDHVNTLTRAKRKYPAGPLCPFSFSSSFELGM